MTDWPFSLNYLITRGRNFPYVFMLLPVVRVEKFCEILDLRHAISFYPKKLKFEDESKNKTKTIASPYFQRAIANRDAPLSHFFSTGGEVASYSFTKLYRLWELSDENFCRINVSRIVKNMSNVLDI